ncbi:MAG: hypothetical protein AABN95_07475 [Acidobacteriota bacterium]
MKNRIEPLRVGELQNLSPEVTSYRGILWLMTTLGELYQTSSGATQLSKCATLPGSGFSFPLSIDEDDRRGPSIHANNNETSFRYDILSGKYEGLFDADGNYRAFASAVVRHAESFYYLTKDFHDDAITQIEIRSSGAKLRYSLQGLSLLDSSTSPLQHIGTDLWVITREKLIVFPNFSADAVKELDWNPWRIWVTAKGIWYSEKLKSGYSGNRQSILRVTFEGKEIERYSLEEELLLTAKIAASPRHGQIAAFTPQAIQIFDFAMNKIDELAGIVQIHSPQGILFTPPFLFWFEAINRSVFAWHIRTSKVYELWSFEEGVDVSHLLRVGCSLYGLTKKDIWRWDLLDA